MIISFLRNFVIWFVLFCAIAAGAAEGDVDGVFGLAPMPESAALAIWVPLTDGESIEGVTWYNNDGDLAFPAVLAVAGESDRPETLNDAVVVGENVMGNTLAWSGLTFSQPLASETPGLYLIFELPLSGAFENEGTGSGVGYQVGDGEIRSWVSTDATVWHPLNPDYQMAVEAVMNTDKSGEVLVLRKGRNIGNVSIEETPPAAPLVAGMTVAPNPFNPQTEIQFTLPSKGEVKLTIYDVRGRRIQTLVDEPLEAGVHAVNWSGRDGRGRRQASGMYLALLQAGSVRLTKRLTLVQ